MESLQMLEQGMAACVKNAEKNFVPGFIVYWKIKRCMELGEKSKEYVERRAGASERCLPYWFDGYKFLLLILSRLHFTIKKIVTIFDQNDTF